MSGMCELPPSLPNDLLKLILNNVALNGDHRLLDRIHGVVFYGDVDLRNHGKSLHVPLTLDHRISDTHRWFSLPFFNTKVCNIVIDWGDGKMNTFLGKFSASHYYDNIGNYRVRVFPNTNAPRNDLSKPCLTHIGGCGPLDFSSQPAKSVNEHDSTSQGSTTIIGPTGPTGSAGIGTPCWADSITLFETLGTLGITSLADAFACCYKFNIPINHLRVDLVTNLSRTFCMATAFNQPLGLWNTSQVRRMDFVFENATSFAQDLCSWHVKNVTDVYHAFKGAKNFKSRFIKDWPRVNNVWVSIYNTIKTQEIAEF